MKFPIYLDYSATTPVDPRVAQKMIPFLTEQFGNAASRSHAFGWEAEKAVEEARGHVAALLNADSKEIIWTSGATEGNNLAIKGAANFYKGKGRHIVTMKTEHKAALGDAPHPPDRRHGRGVPHREARDGGRGRAHPRLARPAARRLQGHGRGVRQRRHRAAYTGKPQRQLQLRRGRVPHHGDQGRGGVLGPGLHFREPRTPVSLSGARA